MSRSGGPVLLTQGFTAVELLMDPEVAAFSKKMREANFPGETLRKGLVVDITTSEASVPLDKQRIINTVNGIAHVDLDTVIPDLNHAACVAVNGMLRSIFAEVSLPMCRELQETNTALAVLALDTERTSVNIEARWSNIRDMGCVGAALAKMEKLEEVRMWFMGCEDLEDLSGLHALEGLGCLRYVFLDLTECWCPRVKQGFGELVDALKSHPTLEKMEFADSIYPYEEMYERVTHDGVTEWHSENRSV
eukprot:TRINITY_DN7646_c0_g1_i2.p2 TRINITY_DN7646_c0_g1~~TRINITY_DN7646_c0_g1_i2.p2  ORF type:complete len:249 (-),score=57.70 TRINITY_DN7646_c0_g1_i2:93-839(-)